MNPSYCHFGVVHDRQGKIVKDPFKPSTPQPSSRISGNTMLQIAETLRYRQAVELEKQRQRERHKKQGLDVRNITPDPFYERLELVLTAPHSSWWRDKENRRWLKQCNFCGKALPLQLFGRYNSAEDFLRRYCKRCWTNACLNSMQR